MYCVFYVSLDLKLRCLASFWALHETTITVFQSCSTCDFIGFRVRFLFHLKTYVRKYENMCHADTKTFVGM